MFLAGERTGWVAAMFGCWGAHERVGAAGTSRADRNLKSLRAERLILKTAGDKGHEV